MKGPDGGPLVDRLLVAAQRPATLLAARHAYRVHEADGLRWLYAGGGAVQPRVRILHSGGGAVQSVMSLSAPERPLLPALVHLLSALVWQPAPASALNLGVGGGAIERFVASRLPRLQPRSVEASADVAALAQCFFALPAGCRITISRAEDFVAVDRQRYDLVWCDLFDGERQAACMTSAEFLAALCRRLGERGVLAMNLSPRDEAELMATLVHLRRELPWVALSVRADGGNVGVLASRRRLPPGTVLAARARRLGGGCTAEFAAVADDLIRLPAPAGL